jgi:hypothetical protein
MMGAEIVPEMLIIFNELIGWLTAQKKMYQLYPPFSFVSATATAKLKRHKSIGRGQIQAQLIKTSKCFITIDFQPCYRIHH